MLASVLGVAYICDMENKEPVLCPTRVLLEEEIEVLESSKAFVQVATVEHVTLGESARDPMLDLIEIDRRIKFRRDAMQVLQDSCPLNHTDENTTETVGKCKSLARGIFSDITE